MLLFCGAPDTSATWFWFELPFFFLAVVSILIEFEGRGHEKHKLEYLHCSFHFGPFAVVCFNKNLTECSVLFQEFLWDLSNPRSVSGHSFDMLLSLKSTQLRVASSDLNGLVKTVVTHTGT